MNPKPPWSKKPVHREVFQRFQKRLGDSTSEHGRFIHSLPAMFMMECYGAIRAYHGGAFPAWWAMTWHFAYLGFASMAGASEVWLWDKMGWTKLYHSPGTKTHREYWHRHGWKCSGSPNCNNLDCIEDSLPGWYRFLTRSKKRDET